MKFIGVFLVVLLYGCSGTVYTVQNPTPDKDGRIKGVLVYGYKVVPKQVALDRIRNPQTGEITHSAYKDSRSGEYCEPDTRVENVTVADYSKPYALQYDAGFLETSKFGVTLDKGMLASVNSESTPGAKTAVESLQALASLREDVLNGFVKASEVASAQSIQDNIEGSRPADLPIRCSAPE